MPPRPSRARLRQRPTKDLLSIELTKELLVASEHGGLRLDRFVHLMMPWRSRQRIKSEIEAGTITLNGRRQKPTRHVHTDDLIKVQVTQAPDVIDDVAEVKLNILYEDDNILVLNKDPYTVAHPTGRRLTGTIIQAVHYRYREALAKDPDFRPRLLHRLDRETSGVLLISKRMDVHRFLARQFEHRKVKKEYLAIVEGIVAKGDGLINLGIGSAVGSRVEIKKGIDTRKGARAVTRFVVKERLPRHTLVRLYPLTGRGHQLRVHLAAIGHPILGDELYRDETVFLNRLEGQQERSSSGAVIGRHALHAHKLTLCYPDDKTMRTCTAPLPHDMREALKRLRRG